jgi:serine/threonine protein kinase
MERSAAAKIYFENYFDKLVNGKSFQPTASSSRSRRRMQLEQELDRMGLSDSDKTRIRQEWLTREHALIRISREKMSLEKFHLLKPLGKGAFGKVHLVRELESGQVYAMKVLSKEHMLRQNQESHVRAERDMLSDAASNDSCRWLIKLVYSFQDFDHLYFVMDYLPGGDLLTLLIQYDVFPEEMARFYAGNFMLRYFDI